MRVSINFKDGEYPTHHLSHIDLTGRQKDLKLFCVRSPVHRGLLSINHFSVDHLPLIIFTKSSI